MKVIHLIVGLFVVIVFLSTGKYMEFHHPKMNDLDDGVRMMFRSRHIYILLAGLVNLSLGTHFNYRKQLWYRILHISGSCLIIVAPFLFIVAFFYEPMLNNLQTPFTLPAVIMLFSGVLCHFLTMAERNKNVPSL